MVGLTDNPETCQPSLFSLVAGGDFENTEIAPPEERAIELTNDSINTLDEDEPRSSVKKTYVLPAPGTPGYQLLIKYRHFGLKVLFALDTDEHIFTQEEVDRAIYEIDYRINAMQSLIRFEPDLEAVAELNAEIPGLIASILQDVSVNSRWLDEEVNIVDKYLGVNLHINCRKLPKFRPTVEEIYSIN